MMNMAFALYDSSKDPSMNSEEQNKYYPISNPP